MYFGMRPSWGKLSVGKQETFLKITILALSCVISFSIRLFAVVKHESVIHEFDPYFNYRTTKFLVDEGYMSFYNWFDDRVWYPLGRDVGGTIYPGLMVTSALIHRVLSMLNITIDVRNVCVFFAPIFSCLTCLFTYFLTAELHSTKAGLFAAAMVAIVPGYISRSVAGSYDNEGIAIFCMILTYYAWIKSVKTGQIYWSVLAALSYFYMVSSWGGYVFLINLIPLHVFTLMVCGRFCHRHYVAYSCFYVVGTVLSMQVSFVGFQPVETSEHLFAFGVFGLCQIYTFVEYLYNSLDKDDFNILLRTVFGSFIAVLFVVIVLLSISGKIAPFTGRFYALLDPSYAKKNIPIIASVSEHRPTAWSSFYFDFQILTILFPAGIYFCFSNLSDHNIFLILYGVTSVYFAGVMVRLMLVLAPAMCIISGIAISVSLSTQMKYLRGSWDASSHRSGHKKVGRLRGEDNNQQRELVATAFVIMICFFMITYVYHCIWATNHAYSSTTVILTAHVSTGRMIIFDDFREAYYWLRMNTPEDAKIMSWWDYGYQLSAMANRTVIVDNNTWNNSHIARVGQVMAQDEEKAYPILQELDVDYLLVVFGGLVSYGSDDIAKFLWMVRIAGSIESGKHIKESDYFDSSGQYRVDEHANPVFLRSMMYKMCYYRFGQVYTEGGKPSGYDRVRQAEIGSKDFELDTIEEAYTSEHWMVRIYRVKKQYNRGVA